MNKKQNSKSKPIAVVSCKSHYEMKAGQTQRFLTYYKKPYNKWGCKINNEIPGTKGLKVKLFTRRTTVNQLPEVKWNFGTLHSHPEGHSEETLSLDKFQLRDTDHQNYYISWRQQSGRTVSESAEISSGILSDIMFWVQIPTWST